MKTPINELIEKLSEHTWYDEDGCPHVNISIINLDYFIEKEKQMIIDAYTACWGNDGGNEYHKEPEAEQYYNETFKP